MAIWPRSSRQQSPSEPAAKRISTPAGHRLSAVLGSNPQKRNSVQKSTPAVTVLEPRESSEGQSQNSSGYSYSVWSDGEKFAVFRNNRQITKRGGWKKILIIVAIAIAAIIALAVGLAVGLKKKGSNGSNSQSPASSQASSTADTNNRPADPLPAPPSLSADFPVGSYSMVTFLDTIQTNCTSNPLTWTCYPDTIYNTDHVKSVATFNWIISSSSKGKFQISSDGDNPFSISFKNVALELLDEGNEKERYRFQFSQTKTVTPAQSILKDDNAKVECDFASTSLQAFLYTKMERSYPNTGKGEPAGNPKSPVWPFAVRIEQAVGGGENVPSCRKVSTGEPITQGFNAQDASGLCSCLYRNWRTPSPYS